MSHRLEQIIERLGTAKVEIITSNRGKFHEFRDLLEPLGIETRHRPMHYPEVQADSLEEVVRFGLQWISRERAGEEDAAIVDDSGLFIDALRGFPGVYSSHALRTIGNEGILKLLAGVPYPKRCAHFSACLGLMYPAPEEGGWSIHLFSGSCPGHVAEEMKGHGGFGFDPIFIPSGYDTTFAEMPIQEKNLISHRGRAMAKLLKYLSGEDGED